MPSPHDSGELRTCGTFITVEYAHSGHVMLTELASPEELCLIEEISLGLPVANRA